MPAPYPPTTTADLSPLPTWQRHLLLVVLGPLLWLQGRYVRHKTPRLPEPPGARVGIQGQGSVLRLLVVGDSAAAGVGAATQAQALSGQLLQHLQPHYTVHWQLHAGTGDDSPALLRRLQDIAPQPFDVVVVSMGANDVTGLCAPTRWVAHQHAVAHVVHQRFAPRLLVHCAVPPMHVFTALPQPLRWFMGRWAHTMNVLLHQALSGHPWRTPFMLPTHEREAVASGALASDNFHPGPLAYAAWGRGLAQHILHHHDHPAR